MHIGMMMQVVALAALTVPDTWLSVPYVMAAQALSGIAKDLNKMSAKASVKVMADDGSQSKLFKWVAVLTGSKNALKGAGFFVGAALLEWVGFRSALGLLAGMLFGIVFAINSAVHSCLILAYSDHDKVAMNVGFYYMANAGGRLVGTLISGWAYQTQGLEGCLWWSTAFVLLVALLSFRLPDIKHG